jgi:GntR family transcriptional regulator/MocR family aminotransferase
VFEQLLDFGRPNDPMPFSTGRCSVDDRSAETWRRLSQRSLRALGPAHLGYSDPRGLPELRAAVCEYLRAARAVRCEPDQIVITSGTQQAVDLAIRVLLRPNDEVWIEDPCYLVTHGALVAAGMRARPIPVDDHGLDVARGLRIAPRARAVYVTPSHQYPLGVVLSMARRMALLDWARATGAWIVEDDYDSVFRYAGRPLASLQGLDDDGRVIHTGSLNKMLFPGLRMGYAVVPRGVLPAYVNVRNLVDRHPATVNQAVLAEFMREGHFTAHLRRTRLVYERARDALAEELARRATDHLALEVPEQGMHLTAFLREGISDLAVERAARAGGVAVRAISRTYLRAPRRSGLILGFTGHATHAIRGAAIRLVEIVRAHARGRR